MPAGRPPKYDSIEAMQEAIDAWFDAFSEKPGTYPTMSGLAYHLGFSDRQSLYDYKNKPEFACTIKRALLRIEMLHEGNLFHQGSTGSIFWLKNRDWSDKSAIDHTSNGETMKMPLFTPPDESKVTD